MRWNIDESNQDTGLPLEGIRILDFARVVAGPLVGMVAGDLGADVIKVESPAGDPVHSMAPPTYAGLSTYYLSVNRHRRNVVADLTNPRDRAAIMELLGQADAVIENFLPSQYRSLNIAELRAVNPDLVWVSVTGASSDQPLALEPSFDVLAQARSGIMSVTGEAQGPPTKVGAPIADVVTGLYATIGLLSGLLARQAGRPGRHFEASLLESTMSALVNQAQGYLAADVVPTRRGNEHPSIVPYGPLTASDGQLMVAVGTDAQFARLIDVIGDETLLVAAAQWGSNTERVADRENLLITLNRCFATQTKEEWAQRLSEAGIPCAPILAVDEAFAQSTIREGDFVGLMDVPGGRVRSMRSPLRIDGKRPVIRRGPRERGQDSAELLGPSA
jgi:crotonobetainyl-CoA:carnitine CoA-transferase CaiB-like acyl-CoA transferase